MTAQKKTLRKERTFTFRNKRNPICKLLTIYMSIPLINMSKDAIKHCCKVSVLFVWQYVTYITNLKSFYILLNSLLIPYILFYFILKLNCVLTRHKNINLSKIEYISSYLETVKLSKINLLLRISIFKTFFLKKNRFDLKLWVSNLINKDN